MIKFIVVDNIDVASAFYECIFDAIPQQELPEESKVTNKMLAIAAGFIDSQIEIDISMKLLKIPYAKFIIELINYNSMMNMKLDDCYKINNKKGLRHICFKVYDIQHAFEFLKKQHEVKIDLSINEDNSSYFKVKKESVFFPLNKEGIMTKQKICNIKFTDKYGVQWELEEGHLDIYL